MVLMLAGGRGNIMADAGATRERPRPPAVLIIGIDPHAVAHLYGENDAVLAALARDQARFDAAGIPVDVCLVGLDQERATGQILTQLTARAYGCVVIGGGIRTFAPLLEFFERVVNLVRQHAPQAAIAFNATPDTSFEAAQRWLPSSDGTISAWCERILGER